MHLHTPICIHNIYYKKILTDKQTYTHTQRHSTNKKLRTTLPAASRLAAHFVGGGLGSLHYRVYSLDSVQQEGQGVFIPPPSLKSVMNSNTILRAMLVLDTTLYGYVWVYRGGSVISGRRELDILLIVKEKYYSHIT